MSWPCVYALWVAVCACLPRVWSIFLRRSQTRHKLACKTHANSHTHTHIHRECSAPLVGKDTSHRRALLATRSSCHGQASMHFGWLSVPSSHRQPPWSILLRRSHTLQTHAKCTQIMASSGGSSAKKRKVVESDDESDVSNVPGKTEEDVSAPACLCALPSCISHPPPPHWFKSTPSCLLKSCSVLQILFCDEILFCSVPLFPHAH